MGKLRTCPPPQRPAGPRSVLGTHRPDRRLTRRRPHSGSSRRRELSPRSRASAPEHTSAARPRFTRSSCRCHNTPVEETVFYPAVRARCRRRRRHPRSPRGAPRRQVDAVGDVVDAVRGRAFRGQGHRADREVRHHVREEEGELFPKVRNSLRGKARRARSELVAAKAEPRRGPTRGNLTPRLATDRQRSRGTARRGVQPRRRRRQQGALRRELSRAVRRRSAARLTPHGGRRDGRWRRGGEAVGQRRSVRKTLSRGPVRRAVRPAHWLQGPTSNDHDGGGESTNLAAPLELPDRSADAPVQAGSPARAFEHAPYHRRPGSPSGARGEHGDPVDRDG